MWTTTLSLFIDRVSLFSWADLKVQSSHSLP
jgi:hypothetical protein